MLDKFSRRLNEMTKMDRIMKKYRSRKSQGEHPYKDFIYGQYQNNNIELLRIEK